MTDATTTMAEAGEAAEVAVDVRCVLWNEALPRIDDFCCRAAIAAMTTARAEQAGVEISIVLADDDFVQTLNKSWRDQDSPTNVLAFPSVSSTEEFVQDGAGWLLGDVVVAYETTRREADGQQKPFDHHLAHLIVHGVFHLLGYDHDTDDAADQMEALEARTLALLDIENPYGGGLCG